MSEQTAGATGTNGSSVAPRSTPEGPATSRAKTSASPAKTPASRAKTSKAPTSSKSAASKPAASKSPASKKTSRTAASKSAATKAATKSAATETGTGKPAKARAAASRTTASGATSAKPAKPAESHAALVRRARRINRELAEAYPYAHPELDFENPFQLLIATVLSAQTTDLRVNQTTPALFARFPTPEDMAAADPEEMEAILRPTGFFRAKTKAVIGLSAALRDRFGGEVPGRLEDLVTLPGVGRKTANVVLGNAFGVPGLTVDTHFGRLARRFGWTTAQEPEKVEADVAALFPKSEWTMLSHRLIFHGRRVCHSRKPACGACPIAPLCPSYGEGETDPAKAEKLLKYEKAGAPGQRLKPPADFPGPAARPLEAS